MWVGVYIAGRSPGGPASSTFGPGGGSKEGRDDVTHRRARGGVLGSGRNGGSNMFTRQARKARRQARSGTRYEVNDAEIERIMALMRVIKRGRERYLYGQG